MSRKTILCLSVALLGGLFVRPMPQAHASSVHQDAADFLYELAEEHRRSGQLSEAIREFREVLILNPSHTKARAALTELEKTAQNKRQEVMDDVLGRVAGGEAGSAFAAAVGTPVVVDVPAPSFGGSVRFPDASTGAEWLYVFGPEGKAEYGALPNAQRIFIDLPKGSAEPLTVQVLDADIRGGRDEWDGSANTTTVFRLLAGGQVLESQTIGPETRDGTTLTFGPYATERGEALGDRARFCLEAEGLKGNDNNLFALDVSPASADCFSEQLSLRLPQKQGSRVQFYPQVPAGSSQVLVEQNYDLDPSGGRAVLVPVAQDGEKLGTVALASSDSGDWSRTEVAVPMEAAGTRWIYRVTKETQAKANMGFKISDQSGRPLPIYGEPEAAKQPAPGRLRPVLAEPPTGCNVFHFDASKSYDPDRDALAYLWDFGDGTTTEGVEVDHTYAEAGTYRVRLQVKDSTTTDCCVAEVEQVLPVNLPPVAVIEAADTTCAAAAARFSAAKSRDSAGETLSYRWDFGDGATAQGAEADHVFVNGGDFDVVLTVDDGRGTACSTAQAVAKVHVNSPPVVRVTDSIRSCASQPTGPIDVTLSAAGSRDADGDALSFSWDFGDGSRGAGEEVSHAYQQAGRFTATVTADDGSGTSCSSASGVVSVILNHPPVAAASLPSAGCPEKLVTFNGTNSSDADNQALVYRWDFGDGHSAEGATVQHAYTNSGRFTARLTVRDSSGMSCDSATDEVALTINAPPVAHMTIRGGGGLLLTAPADSNTR